MQQFHAPAWLDDAVFYEIYPQSFQDTNADGIGDFQGIIDRLDYIRELGCNALWLNPCFASPFGDAGYDVSDYYTAAPRYGTNADLRRLFLAAHERGMHVLLDLVPGHTSWDHPWFRASMQAERNEFTDRYVWTDSVWEAPEGMESLRGISDRDGACAVNFFSHQPALNYGFYRPDKPWQQAMNDPGPIATRAAMRDVMRFWLSMGCDGFRVDMAGSLVKNDPEQKGTIALWQDIHSFLAAEFPEAAMVSEWGQPDRALAGGFHMDFLLHFGPSHYTDLFRSEKPWFDGEGDVSAFVQKYLESAAQAGERGLICIPSGNHDMPRLAHTIHGDRLRIAMAFLFTMPGAPFLYYGDEIGMRYLEGLTSKEGGFHRTGARSPMQWDDSVNAGFSTAPSRELYIPLDLAPDRPTVARQMADPGSLWHQVQGLIALRQAHPALRNRGGIEFLYAEKDAYPLAYLRTAGTERVLVVLNPSARTVSFPCALTPDKELCRIGGGLTKEGDRISIPADSAVICRVE